MPMHFKSYSSSRTEWKLFIPWPLSFKETFAGLLLFSLATSKSLSQVNRRSIPPVIFLLRDAYHQTRSRFIRSPSPLLLTSSPSPRSLAPADCIIEGSMKEPTRFASNRRNPIPILLGRVVAASTDGKFQRFIYILRLLERVSTS